MITQTERADAVIGYITIEKSIRTYPFLAIIDTPSATQRTCITKRSQVKVLRIQFHDNRNNSWIE